MTSRVDEILTQLQARGPKAWDAATLLELKKKDVSPLTQDEELELVGGLVKLDIFLWLDYIGLKLKELASVQDSYVDIISEIVNKVKLDLAQGPIINALTQIGESSPQLGIDLAAKMQRRNDEILAIYSSFPLGGAGRVDYAQVKSRIGSLWHSACEFHEVSAGVAAVRTFRVIFSPYETKTKNIPPDVFSFMELAALSPDTDIVQEASDGLFDFAKIDEARVMVTLARLAQNNALVRGHIARRLELKGTLSSTNTVALLKLLITDDDPNVLSYVARILAYQGSQFPKEAMEIIIDLVVRGKYHTVYMLDYAAEEVGAADVKGAIALIQNALPETKHGYLTFEAPYLLVDVCKSNLLLLTTYLKEWLVKPALRYVALKTLREALGNAFDTQNISIAESIYPTLESNARANGMNIEKTLGGNSNKIEQCIHLVDELLAERPKLDFSKIEENWKQFPALQEFLGDQWMKDKKTENNNIHEILYDLAYLSREAELEKLQSEPSLELTPMDAFVQSMRLHHLLHPLAMLCYLEDMVEAIKILPGTRSLKEGLRSEDRFPQSFSELQIAYAFAHAGFTIVLGPPAGAGKLDLQATIEGTPILIEVITPDMIKSLKYSTKAVMIPNRARAKIYDEFKNHLAELPKDTTTPIIIVIDAGRSEIDYDFVADYLYGTTQFTFWVDKKTGKQAGGAWTRAKDSLSEYAKDSPENLNLISGVLCYKTTLGSDGKFHLTGMIFTNPTAQNQLTESQLSHINGAVFT
jgi:hypothetical protein